MRTITKRAIILLITFSIAAFAQEKGTFTDPRDKKTYKTVKIGGQTWMAENLNYDDKNGKCFGEGDKVLVGDHQNKKYVTLSNAEVQANCKKYGRLYSWEAALKACPKGWHLPSEREWNILVNYVGGISTAGSRLRATSGWKDYKGEPSNGTDDHGFSALPGGEFSKIWQFEDVGKTGYWWGSTKGNQDRVTCIGMHGVDNRAWAVDGCPTSSGEKYSVRCVLGNSSEEAEAQAKAEMEAAAKVERDAAEKVAVENAAGKQFNPKIKYGTMTDARDKATYKTTKIGSQTWMAENLNYNANGSKCYKDLDYFCKRDGRLYDFEMSKTACPAGWHLPTQAEWNALANAVGGASTAGTKLKAISGWFEAYGKKNPINGTDDFGFSALPTGAGGYNSGKDFKDANAGTWWSASEDRGINGIAGYINSLEQATEKFSFSSQTKTILFSIRCVQGDAPKEAPSAQPTPQSTPKPPPSGNENCVITFPKKTCVSMPGGSCSMAGGKVVDKCP